MHFSKTEAVYLKLLPPFQKKLYSRKKNCFKKYIFTFLMYYLMKICKLKKIIVFIGFLLAKNYEKLLLTKNNIFIIKL